MVSSTIQRKKGQEMIELLNVSKKFGDGVPIVALADVDLKVDAGEFVVVLGPSGSGKTTLLNMVGALDNPSEGTIVVNGVDISEANRKQLFEFRRTTVSFIFQSFNIFPGLTAAENVQFGADAAGRIDDVDPAEILTAVGLGERVDQFPHELSGGEQQRVAIARALATGNPVMLADEPTGELDFVTGVQILELLQKQAADGRAVLVVTHNREISRIADRVVELSSGHIVSDGPPAGGKASLAELHW
jgi:putative ABC transport system ATP-binding protein